MNENSMKYQAGADVFISKDNSSMVIMKADRSSDFKKYRIKEDALLFINTDEPYEPGRLSIFTDKNSYRIMRDKRSGYEYVGRLISAINYYF